MQVGRNTGVLVKRDEVGDGCGVEYGVAKLRR